MSRESRTYADRREYIIKAVTKRRRKVKAMAIVYKGGRCQLCGYDKYQGALDLHHLDRDTKAFGISYRGYCRAWRMVKEELDKCLLVCVNCHREIEGDFRKLDLQCD